MSSKRINEEPILKPERFQGIDLDDTSVFAAAFDHVLRKADEGMKEFDNPSIFPSPNSVNGHYQGTEYYSWTNGFWTGLIWLCYEMTGDSKYRQYAEKQLEGYYDHRMKQKIETDDQAPGMMTMLLLRHLKRGTIRHPTAIWTSALLFLMHLASAGLPILAWTTTTCPVIGTMSVTEAAGRITASGRRDIIHC